MLEQGSRAALEPTETGTDSSRILSLDVLRGVALFGILLVNMRHFSSPALYLGGSSGEGAFPLDRLVDALILFFAQGKFFPLFSFLFGLGLVLQLQRWQAKGAPSTRLFLRRLGVLLVIGLLHATLIWAGDILAKYAVLGLLFLVLLPLPPRMLLGGSGLLLMAPILLSGTGLEERLTALAGFPAKAEGLKALAEQSLAVYGSGSFVEMTRQRLLDFAFRFVSGSYFSGLFTILGMFCLGAYAGRRGLFLPSNLGRFRQILLMGFVGFALSLAGFVASRALPLLAAPPLLKTLHLAGNLSMTACYVAGLVLLLERTAWRARLAPLASAGRMALSNYLLQSLLATAIFYGTGLYGRLGSAACLGITVAIFAGQVFLSRYWLSHFRFGPLEWLWRWATYGKRPGMRREAAL
ncbi:hypothetical protein D3C87_748570 [compost metagenome]